MHHITLKEEQLLRSTGPAAGRAALAGVVTGTEAAVALSTGRTHPPCCSVSTPQQARKELFIRHKRD